MKLISVLALSLVLLAGSVEAKKSEEPTQNYLIVCGTSPQNMTVALQGPVLYWEMHVKNRNPYLEVQFPGQQFFHYMQAGETCSIREIDESELQGSGAREEAPNA